MTEKRLHNQIRRRCRRRRDFVLSKDVTLPEMPGSSTLEVATSRLVTGTLQSDLHMEFAAVGNRVSVLYDPGHVIFTNTLTEPVDCLVRNSRTNCSRGVTQTSEIGQFPGLLNS